MENGSCARCGGALESGFASVFLDGTATPVFWVGGTLERELLTRGANLEDRERLPLITHRCTKCGNVEWES